jgi:integration host factor subunit beta
MTRSDLAKRVANRCGIGDVRAEQLVETIFECMQAALERNERIDLRGFGTFRMNSYRAYEGRNPKTGEAIHVKPKRLPYFKPGAPLSVRLNRPRSGSRLPSPAPGSAPGRQAPPLGDLARTNDSA